MRRTLAFLSLGLTALAAAQYPGSTPPPKDLKVGFDAIKVSDAQDILGYLAGPECEGRGTGQPGFQKAAEFVAARFKAAGLKPMGDDGTYFQNATFYRPSATAVRMTTADGAVLDDALVVLTPFGKDLDLSAPVAVVRASATDRLSDDQVKSLAGKIVIALIPAGRTAIVRQLGQSEAKAVLTVADRVKPLVPRASMRRPGDRPIGTVTGQIARDALSRLGPAVGALAASTNGGPGILVLPRDVRLTAKGSVEEVKVPNVVGMVEGSDPTLKAETIGIGGHLDHLGINAVGVVYPGADDDGSGSTAVMLVARAVATNKLKPKRSVLFMTFFGEEMGLLGSKYLTEHPPVPLDKMVAELQMDMVGRDSDGAQNGDPNRMDRREENVDTIRLVGSKRISTDLDRTIMDMNRHVGFRFKYDAEDVYTRSDHYNFAAKGIPIAFLFDGFHPDYHQPTDTVDKIDWAKLTNAAKLYYLTVMKLANDPKPPVKDVKG